jgi:hypothetical protein
METGVYSMEQTEVPQGALKRRYCSDGHAENVDLCRADKYFAHCGQTFVRADKTFAHARKHALSANRGSMSVLKINADFTKKGFIWLFSVRQTGETVIPSAEWAWSEL